MDYQGQNVNPNSNPDMGQSVAAPNILETPDLSHDVQGMGAIGSSAAAAEVEQLVNGDMPGQESNIGSETIDLLGEMPPLYPTEMTASTEQAGPAPVEREAVSTTSGTEIKAINNGKLSQRMADRMDKEIDSIDKDLAGFYDRANDMIENTYRDIRGGAA